MKAMDSHFEKSRQKKEEKLKKRMERKKRARALGISEEELARQEGESDDEEEDEKSIKTTDMLKDLQVITIRYFSNCLNVYERIKACIRKKE